ncbi:MAG: hypothetical protein ACLQNE_37465 [Thermoguttaceae bacterium]
MLDELLPRGCTLVTTDREIHWLHSTHTPDEHSGILIIATSNSSRTIRIHDVEQILRQFKSDFLGWYSMSLRNLVVEITEQQVEVWKVVGGIIKRFGWVEFTKAGWQDELRDLMARNAKGGQAISNDG